jgi:hypothetical protein
MHYEITRWPSFSIHLSHIPIYTFSHRHSPHYISQGIKSETKWNVVCRNWLNEINGKRNNDDWLQRWLGEQEHWLYVHVMDSFLSNFFSFCLKMKINLFEICVFNVHFRKHFVGRNVLISKMVIWILKSSSVASGNVWSLRNLRVFLLTLLLIARVNMRSSD